MPGRGLAIDITVDRGSGDEVLKYSAQPVPGYQPRIINDPTIRVLTGNALLGGQHRSAIGETAVGAVDLANADLALNDLRGADIRDKSIVLRIGDLDNDVTTWPTLQRIGDRIELIAEETVRIVFGDVLAALEQRLQTKFYADDHPVERRRGQPVPISLGRPFQVPAVLVDTGTLVFDVHDGQVADIDSVQDNAVELTEGTDWTETATGFDLDNRTGKITATPQGESVATHAGWGSNLTTNGDFADWKLDDPEQWSVTENSPDAVVTEEVTGECTMKHSSGSTIPSITQDLGLEQDRRYRVTLDILQIASVDELRIEHNGSTIQSWQSADGTGTKQIEFVAGNDTSLKLVAEANDANSDVRIDNVIVEPELLDFIAQTTIGELLTAVASTRMGQAVDQASIDALDTAIGSNEAGIWVARETSAADILRDLLDSVGASAWADDQGRVAVGRLDAPSGTPDLTIRPYHLLRPTEVQTDLAPGLTTALRGGRNWQPIGQSDAGGSISDDAKEDAAAEWRETVQLDDAITLDGTYDAAGKACAAGVLLNGRTALQTEIDRRGNLYTQQRSIYTVVVPTSIIAPTDLVPLQVVRLYDDELGLQAGIDTRLLGGETTALGDAVTLWLWG